MCLNQRDGDGSNIRRNVEAAREFASRPSDLPCFQRFQLVKMAAGR